MNSPVISIIVPCYNGENFISKALESVYIQTFKDWECVIVDDGSTDNSKTEISSWLKKDNRFNYVYQKNKGLSGARNKGISEAKGDFVYFLDSDDLLDIDALQNLFNLMGSDVDIVFGKNAITIGQNRIVKSEMDHAPRKLTVHTNDSKSLLALVIEEPLICVAWNRLYRLSFLKQHSLLFTPELLHEDELWFFETLFYAKGIVLNDKITYYYNVSNENSITNNYGISNLEAYLKIIDLIYNKYYKKFENHIAIISIYIIHLKILTLTHCYFKLANTDEKRLESMISKTFRMYNVQVYKDVLNIKLTEFFSGFVKTELLPFRYMSTYLTEYYSKNVVKNIKRSYILLTASVVQMFNSFK